jgi:hypothetical protein
MLRGNRSRVKVGTPRPRISGGGLAPGRGVPPRVRSPSGTRPSSRGHHSQVGAREHRAAPAQPFGERKWRPALPEPAATLSRSVLVRLSGYPVSSASARILPSGSLEPATLNALDLGDAVDGLDPRQVVLLGDDPALAKLGHATVVASTALKLSKPPPRRRRAVDGDGGSGEATERSFWSADWRTGPDHAGRVRGPRNASALSETH